MDLKVIYNLPLTSPVTSPKSPLVKLPKSVKTPRFVKLLKPTGLAMTKANEAQKKMAIFVETILLDMRSQYIELVVED